MANDMNNTNGAMVDEQSSGATPRFNGNRADKKGKNPKGTGLLQKTALNGISKGYQVDGSVSVPSQGNIVFSRATGKQLKLFASFQSNPCFMRASYLPIFGSDKRQQTWAALTNQGENLWRTIRSATPHAENYQAGDVMTNIVVTAGLKIGLAEARRKITSVAYQAYDNQFIQNGIYKALNHTVYDNVRLSELQKKLVGWGNAYNGIINRLSGIKTPDIFPIFNRWEYLSSTIFRDAEDENQAQFFAFTATHIYDWEVREDPDDPGIDLVPKTIPEDIDELLSLLEDISIKVTSDSDMSDMYSDLVLAYPTAQCLKWNLWDAPKVGTPFRTVHDMDVKWAFHNAQIVRVNAPTWHVTPEQGSIHGQVVAYNGKYNLGFAPPIMGTNFDKMDMAKFYNLSQWVVWDDEGDYDTASGAIQLINLPTEILTGLRIFWFKWDFATGDRTVGMTNVYTNAFMHDGTDDWSNTSETFTSNDFRNLQMHATFAYAPMMRVFYVKRLSSSSMNDLTPDTMLEQVHLGCTCEVEKPFLVNSKQLGEMRNAARVGLWNIPTVLLNGKRNGGK